MISELNIKTLLMISKDDPIVSYRAMPHEKIKENVNIKFVTT
jgi:predicted alpha/beta-fold hydrolase